MSGEARVPAALTARWPQLVGAAVAVLVLTTGFGVAGGVLPGPCTDAPTLSPADVDVDLDVAPDRSSITVVYRRGPVLTDEHTRSLAVTLRTADGSSIRQYRVADSLAGLPIAPGAAVAVVDPRVGGRSLQAGDRVALVWHARAPSRPAYCLPGDGRPDSVTIAELTAGDDTAA